MSNKFIETIKAAIFVGAAMSTPAHADSLNLTSSFVDRDTHTEEVKDLAEQAEKQGCVGNITVTKSDLDCSVAKEEHIKTELLARHLSLNGISLDTSGYLDLHQDIDSTAVGIKTGFNFDL